MSISPKLKFFDLAMIVVSLVIGIGIFRTPAIVAAKSGIPVIFFTAWILGGIVSTCGALTFAEIGSRYPAAGGFYKIFSHCYHPSFAFMLNWSLVITNAASAVGVALVGAEYIAPVIFPAEWQTDIAVKCLAVIMVLILFGLNFLGIRAGARAQNVLSLIKIVMVLIFCLSAFGHPAVAASSQITPLSHDTFIKVLGISLISVFFTYGGYQNTINFGADIEQPGKNIPKAIFTGMGIVVVLYVGINYAYYSVLGFENLQHSKLPAADLAGAFLGNSGRAITSLAIFISVLGFINTSMMSNPRIYYAMADDKVLPGIFKRINNKTMAQEFSLTFFTVLMIISLFMLGAFDKIINYVMFIDSLSMVSAAATIFIFRQRAARSPEGDTATAFRLKFYPLIPILFIAMQLVVTVYVFINDTQSAMYSIIIFAAGLPIYLGLKKILAS